MKKPLKCIAVDLGASGGKIFEGSFDGSRISLKEVYRFPNYPVQLDIHIYWDVLRLFEDIKKGLAISFKESNKPYSVGLDTWGNDFCLLDNHGNLIENPHSYRDPMTDGIMSKAFERMSRKDIYQQTGVQFMQHNTLFQLYSMVLEDSPLLKAASTYLMVPDLFNYWMTGTKYCEFTNATTTQFFDPYTNDWHTSILKTFHIPDKIMPPIIKPGTTIGKMAKWLCNNLDIKPVLVIAVGSHDTASAVSAVPAVGNSHAFLSSGTWSLFGAELNSPLINTAGLKYNFSCYGGVGNRYLLWKNIQALWLLQECQRQWMTDGFNYTNQELSAIASEAQPFKSIIDTDDRVFLTPGDFPSLIVQYCASTGQKQPNTHGAIVRCILESLALKYRYTFEKLQLVLKRKLNSIYIVGGGSLNELLNQFAADATGVPVITGHSEATAIGNLMQQLITSGEISSLNEAREIVMRSFRSHTYLPKPSSGWDDAYDRFIKVMKLRQVMKK